MSVIDRDTVLVDPWDPARRPLTLQRIRSVRSGTVHDQGDRAGLWQRYGWLRAGLFLDAVESARSRRSGDDPELIEPQPWVREWTHHTVRGLLARTCGTVFGDRPVPRHALDSVIEVVRHRVVAWPFLCAALVAQSVEDLEPGAYLLPGAPHGTPERVGTLDDARLLRVAQGQRWIEGGGGVLFLGLRWAYLAEVLGDGPDAYCEGLLRIGLLGQELVHRITAMEMKARMTPAIIESVAAGIFGLCEADADLLYLLKFGCAP